MAVLTEHACYLHIPKTGGRFVRAALDAAAIPWEEVGSVEPWKLPGRRTLFEFGATGEAARKMHAVPTPAEVEGLYVFAFSRHPVGWLRSFHGHDGGQASGGYLDNRRARYKHFADFAFSVAREDPGIVRELFAAYLVPGATLFPLSSESLVKALTVSCHEFDPAHILEMEHVGSVDHPPVGRGVFAAICKAEHAPDDYDKWLTESSA